MIHLAVSTIALPSGDHSAFFPRLAELGFDGVEIALSRRWPAPAHDLTIDDIALYRRALENAGLRAVGLHSLFFDRPDLSIFAGPDARATVQDHLALLSAICRDLGGRTLIFGSPPVRRRGVIALAEAFAIAVAFLDAMADVIAPHGTTLCFEPLGADETDFIRALSEADALTRAVDRPQIGLHLDVKALVAAGEADPAVLDAYAGRCVHVHASETNLRPITDQADAGHETVGAGLRRQQYSGFVTTEQRMIDDQNPLDAIGSSALVLKSFYYNR